MVVLRRPVDEVLLGGAAAMAASVGTSAARDVVFGRWGLVDQQNNRGW